MRIALACLWQESNSFNPTLTTLRDFETFGLYRGKEMLDALEGANEVGGVIDAAAEAQVRLVPIVRAWGSIGGVLSRGTHVALRNEVLQGLEEAGDIEGVVLLLHGACAAEEVDDVDGHLIADARRVVGDEVPIMVSLDHHANITELMVEKADGLIGHRTEPHNPYETAVLATRLLISAVEGRVRPTMGWCKIPMITHQEQFLTAMGPMHTWFEKARALEASRNVLSVSPFPMQPWLDVREGGWATVVITDGDPLLAKRLAADLAHLAWEVRHEFLVTNSVPPAQAIRHAESFNRGLVVISDVGDAVFAGAAGDSTCLLAEMLRQKIKSPALVPIWDPEVARAAEATGIGGELSVEIGGKRDNRFSSPTRLTARVVGLNRGPLVLDESFYGLKAVDQGVVALLEVGAIKVVVSEKRELAGSHPNVYRQFGVDPASAKMVVLKTVGNVHSYAPMTSEVIRADTPGYSQSRLDEFTWTRLPRPIFGLDEMVNFEE
jgi:microcystin degradation protein MlrC